MIVVDRSIFEGLGVSWVHVVVLGLGMLFNCINSLHISPFLLPNMPPKFHVISLFLSHSIRIPVLRSPMYWLILLVLVIILVEMCTMPHKI